jgi:hypothetical protein
VRTACLVLASSVQVYKVSLREWRVQSIYEHANVELLSGERPS